MLKKWSITNFKSFEGENEFPLSPLTIFCGANSSGKSSLIQGILLIKQTIQDSPLDHALALNGPLVQLGSYTDICNLRHSKKNKTSSLKIGWTFEKENFRSNERVYNRGWYSQEIITEYDNKAYDSETSSLLVPRLKSLSLKGSSVDGKDKAYIKISRPKKKRSYTHYEISPEIKISPHSFIIRSIDPSSEAEIKDRTEGKGNLITVGLYHFIPDEVIVRYHKMRSLIDAKFNSLIFRRIHAYREKDADLVMDEPVPKDVIDFIKLDAPENVRNLFAQQTENEISYKAWTELLKSLSVRQRHDLTRFLKNNSKRIKDTIKKRTTSEDTIEKLPLYLGRDVTLSHSRYFRFQVKYLGPLRDEPKAAYPLQSSTILSDVGIKGERTAAVLNAFQNEVIEYLSPNCLTGKNYNQLSSGTLNEALAEWLQYLNVAESVLTENKGKLGHLLKVKVNKFDNYQDLTNVGVGVSQVLPILVMCLVSSPGDLLIFEQPELHLHPAVQSKLADFFISMILNDRQCLLETHSEYVIERLRLRIVEEESTSEILNKSSIYFFENDNGKTIYRDIKLNEYGSINDWPKDFFDQSMIETQKIISAATKKRKAKSNRTN